MYIRTKTILTPAPKSSQFRSPHLNQDSFDHVHEKQVNLDPITEKESISISTNTMSASMPRHENGVNFDPDTKNKSFFTVTQKPSQLWSLYWNQVNFDQLRNNQINFIPTLKPSQVLYPTLKSSQLRPPTRKLSQFRWSLKIRYIRPAYKKKSIPTTLTRAKEISMVTPKPSDFRPPYNNQVYFDHTKTKPIDAHTKNK